ncbi:Hypothetical predicted protein [Pelobates cultripes]|uniref:Uncharacterized protein n=1 Tax=Pelobates cultripes TaxID=61616 RepID=A0AAD1W2B0_PELCU|nr:Hypothetical predicted protein [Pelobates cultripes]
MRADFQKLAAEIKRDVQAIGERMAHLEDKMEKVIEAHNTLVDTYTMFQTWIQQLETKEVDFEDRTRRNNIRLRGISEDVKQPELR